MDKKKGEVQKGGMHKSYTLYIGIVLIIVSVLIVFAIIFIKQTGNNEYTFEEGYNALKKIDERYDTSFHTEMLNGTIPSADTIQLMLKDLKDFEAPLDKNSQTPDMRALFLFLDIRKLMLTSEWYFQKGVGIGDIGLVTDEDGFSCGEAKYIIDSAFYFNETFIYASKAEEELDDLLYMTMNHPKIWELVGVQDNKTAFYYSDLRYIRHIPLNSMKSLDVRCDIRGINQKTTYTQPFKYTREVLP